MSRSISRFFLLVLLVSGCVVEAGKISLGGGSVMRAGKSFISGKLKIKKEETKDEKASLIVRLSKKFVMNVVLPTFSKKADQKVNVTKLALGILCRIGKFDVHSEKGVKAALEEGVLTIRDQENNVTAPDEITVYDQQAKEDLWISADSVLEVAGVRMKFKGERGEA